MFGPIALMVLYILPKQHDSGSSGSGSGGSRSSHKTTQADLYEVPKHK